MKTKQLLVKLIKEELKASKKTVLEQKYDRLEKLMFDKRLREASLRSNVAGYKAGISAFFREISNYLKQREQDAIENAIEEVPSERDEMLQILDATRKEAVKAMQQVVSNAMNKAKSKQISNPQGFALSVIHTTLTAMADEGANLEKTIRIEYTSDYIEKQIGDYEVSDDRRIKEPPSPLKPALENEDE